MHPSLGGRGLLLRFLLSSLCMTGFGEAVRSTPGDCVSRRFFRVDGPVTLGVADAFIGVCRVSLRANCLISLKTPRPGVGCVTLAVDVLFRLRVADSRSFCSPAESEIAC